ncbi:MAG: trypsin-like peptidase domain-containing protein [Peptostreptococcus sp.]|nr:trypsin-like peptidase domain-containing protein [Peptostreptococcus sp.]
MKFRTFILVVIVAIVSSFGGAFTTLKFSQNNTFNSQPTKASTTTQIISDGSSKSRNVYQAVAQKASPSVVGIITEESSGSGLFSDSNQITKSSGTGFVVDKRGYILTNSHVVSDGQTKTVKVLFNDGTTTSGSVVWYDQSLDLAVVKVNKSNLVPAELGDSDQVTVGDIAIAIGNPLGTDLRNSVTQGIISGLNRDVSTQSSNMSGLLQTDASINSGNSGGPLLNQDGQVIGINTAKANADNLGFSIPINTAKTIVEKIVEGKTYVRPTLGISGLDVKTYTSYTGQDLDIENGIIVRSVKSGSVASKAGLKAGDIITKIGNTEIKTMNDLTKKLYSYSSGSKDTLTVYRNGKTIDLKIGF